MATHRCDFIVLGGGIYGLYAAKLLAESGRSVTLVEWDDAPFARASHINQARVHHGYHYPRSIHTAKKSADYYERFVRDFHFAINQSFRKVYAISRTNSLTNAAQFQRFCAYVGSRCHEIRPDLYFSPDMVEAAFETDEYAVDTRRVMESLLEQLRSLPGVTLRFGRRLQRVENRGVVYALHFQDDEVLTAGGVLNATYASTNQVTRLFGFEPFRAKYELCEVALVDVSERLSNVGITVMDGPFFSVMPFGLGGRHSLTAVAHTPHRTSVDALPTLPCQHHHPTCSTTSLENCNTCPLRPASAWRHMAQLARKYLHEDITITHHKSLFALKTVLLSTETSDARPTLIRQFSDRPYYAAVLSGKLNTIYDLEASLV